MDFFVLIVFLFASVPLAWVLHRIANMELANVPRRTGAFPAAPSVSALVKLPGRGTYEFAVLGTSRYRPALEKIHGPLSPNDAGKEVEAILVLEETNEAVRVEVEGHTVGHLLPDLARQYRQRLAEAGYPNARGACRARISGRRSGINYVDFTVRVDM